MVADDASAHRYEEKGDFGKALKCFMTCLVTSVRSGNAENVPQTVTGYLGQMAKTLYRAGMCTPGSSSLDVCVFVRTPALTDSQHVQTRKRCGLPRQRRRSTK